MQAGAESGKGREVSASHVLSRVMSWVWCGCGLGVWQENCIKRIPGNGDLVSPIETCSNFEVGHKCSRHFEALDGR